VGVKVGDNVAIYSNSEYCNKMVGEGMVTAIKLSKVLISVQKD